MRNGRSAALPIGLDFWHFHAVQCLLWCWKHFGPTMNSSDRSVDENSTLSHTIEAVLLFRFVPFFYSTHRARLPFCHFMLPLLVRDSWPCDPNNQLHLCSLCSWFTINNGLCFAKHSIQRNQPTIFIISSKAYQYVESEWITIGWICVILCVCVCALRNPMVVCSVQSWYFMISALECIGISWMNGVRVNQGFFPKKKFHNSFQIRDYSHSGIFISLFTLLNNMFARINLSLSNSCSFSRLWMWAFIPIFLRHPQ